MAAAASASSPTPHAAVTERRGIPGASFVEDVETFLNQSGLDANSSLAFLQERFFRLFFSSIFFQFDVILLRLQQYKIVEMKLLAQQRDLQVVLFS
ncbi:hypothetical protein BHM03_00023807 [Ensete ventricosum]|nr:hypothetical protein BHM03_00023807 [Ensete ventricosum]